MTVGTLLKVSALGAVLTASVVFSITAMRSRAVRLIEIPDTKPSRWSAHAQIAEPPKTSRGIISGLSVTVEPF